MRELGRGSSSSPAATAHEGVRWPTVRSLVTLEWPADQKGSVMTHRGLAAIAVALSAIGTSLVSAQNALLNPEFNTTDASWDNHGEPGVIAWNAADSRTCPGSGSVVTPCNAHTRIISDCVPYSPQAVSWGEFDLKSSVPNFNTANLRLYVEQYADAECLTDPVLNDFSEQTGALVGTTFEHYELSVDSISVFTQAVRVRVEVYDFSWCATMFGESLYFDSIYFGPANRILDHDFENEDSCPFSKTP